MWLNDYRQVKEEYEARVAEAEAHRKENELVRSARSRQQEHGETSRLASLFRFLHTH